MGKRKEGDGDQAAAEQPVVEAFPVGARVLFVQREGAEPICGDVVRQRVVPASEEGVEPATEEREEIVVALRTDGGDHQGVDRAITKAAAVGLGLVTLVVGRRGYPTLVQAG